ncbi:MAG: branched-chain amino acid ABC transporter permease [Pararhodobacter sp.]|nr:branched-chain amino acid ABC transporter permease [Pararhodobacter sp.]
MFDHITIQLLMGQLLIGLINGSFYAMLALGLAIIFGLMHVVNFAHGALYMLGAFVALILLNSFGVPYWGALMIAPIVVGAFGIVMERLILKPIQELDHLYSLLATFAAVLIIEGLMRLQFGASGLPYRSPLPGGVNLGFMFLPWYRAWVLVFSLIVCVAVWYLIEKTKLGAYLRAANERSEIVESFGINVPLMKSLTYGLGVALAALGGVLAAPIYQVSPSMGSNLMIVIFAVVVIGGMGSIIGAILTGYLIGIVEGLTKVFYPEGSHLAIFVIMILALILRPQGLFSAAEKSR